MGSLLLGALLLGGSAGATEGQAAACLEARVYESYKDGWAVRTASSATLGPGEYRVFLVNLYVGNEYRVLGCGDDRATDIGLAVYDRDGNVLKEDESTNRQPEVVYKPPTSGAYFVVVRALQLSGPQAGVGMAVTYR